MQNKIDQFIQRANKIHHNKYDYSNWTYYGGTSKDYHKKNVPVICPIHGEFTTSVANHLRGSGCPNCAKLVRASKKRKSLSYYKDKAVKIHNNKYDYSLWTTVTNTSKDKVIIICPDHGKFKQTPADHINSKAGCPKCSEIKKSVEYANKNHILHHSIAHIPPSTLEKINDKSWLITQHVTNKRSIPEISLLLNNEVSDSLITTKMKSFGIQIQRHSKSAAESELIDFIASFGVEVIKNERTILDGKEIDIWIPEYDIAIEYNGLYWHSELHKPVNYHLEKTRICESKGIRLLHIFEDEWRYDKEKCKATIKHLLGKSEKGTYGRNVTIKEITWKIAKEFLNKHHLLNAGNAGNYRIGAFDKVTNDLIGVMVFGLSSSERSSDIELKRFVTNKRNNPGLGSKMFKYAVNHNGYTRVIAFVDRRWFTGLVKNYIGFKPIGVTPPAVWWTDGKVRMHRRFITKRELLTKYDAFSSSMSKREMLSKLGYYRIYDCGKIKLEWIRNDVD